MPLGERSFAGLRLPGERRANARTSAKSLNRTLNGQLCRRLAKTMRAGRACIHTHLKGVEPAECSFVANVAVVYSRGPNRLSVLGASGASLEGRNGTI